MLRRGVEQSPEPDYKLLAIVQAWRYGNDAHAFERDLLSLERFIDIGHGTLVGSCVFLENNHRLMRRAAADPIGLRACLIGGDTDISTDSNAYASFLNHATIVDGTRVVTSLVSDTLLQRSLIMHSVLKSCDWNEGVDDSVVDNSTASYSSLARMGMASSIVLRSQLVSELDGLQYLSNTYIVDDLQIPPTPALVDYPTADTAITIV